MKTQTDRIFEHLCAGGSLTPLEALQQFGCMALSQRIGDLREAGVPIDKDWAELPNGKRVRRYRMGAVAHG